MYGCPNCGGNLQFDIASQRLKCEYCNSELDPYEAEKRGWGLKTEEKDWKIEEGEMPVTIFTCPSCGAEIASTNLSATGFCTYCGASAVFGKRVRGQIRPQRIIPFQKTKQDCKEIFEKVIRHNIYAPKEFRDSSFLERFVGVYLPCWTYEVQVGPEISVSGKKSYHRGNYDYIDYYSLFCKTDTDPSHIIYEASSAFDDRIYQSIAPFPHEGMKEFTPGFLSGFYADISDVPEEIYQEQAKAQVGGEIYRRVESCYPDMTVELPGSLSVMEKNLKMKTQVKRAMLPVWFLTWRKKDRVAYTVVNGQTGQVYAELPVDLKRFLVLTLLLAIPLFVVANLFLTITAPTMLAIAAFFSSFTAITYFYQMRSIGKRETRSEDAGFLATKDSSHFTAKRFGEEALEKERKKGGKLTLILTIVMIIGAVLIFRMSSVLDVVYATGLLSRVLHGEGGLLIGFGLVFTLIYTSRSFFKGRELRKNTRSQSTRTEEKEKEKPQGEDNGWKGRLKGWFSKRTPSLFSTPEIIGCLFASLLALIIQIAYPVEDYYYYGGTMICFLGILATLTGVIQKYNLLATRPIPQFHERTKEGNGAIPKGDKKRGAGRTRSKGKGETYLILLFLLGTVLLGGAAPSQRVVYAQKQKVRVSKTSGGNGGGREALYKNETTGYEVYILDDANLLTESEEKLLQMQLQKLSRYGNMGFASGYGRNTSARWYAEERYQEVFGTENGTMMLIDLTNREIRFHSDGKLFNQLTVAKTNTITDNVYRYASRGYYYLCASHAFEQVEKVLKGIRIAQPMKYTSNALLSLIVSLLLNFLFLRGQVGLQNRKRRIMEAKSFVVTGTVSNLIHQTKTRSAQGGSGGGFIGGGGGGGGSRGGGGGGHSGGGGGHRF